MVKYDLAGNKKIFLDKRGFQTDFTYDNLNRLTSTTLPAVLDGEHGTTVRPVVSQSYDRNGNIVQSKDARGLVTVNTYDSLNRLTQKTVKAESDIVTTYTYDRNSNKLSETLQRGDANLTTSYSYDNFNRPVATTDAEGFTESYTYDTVGNKIAVTDKRGNTTSMTYDLMNRLLATALPAVDCHTDGNGASENVRPTTQTVYLKNGWIIEAIDANNNSTQIYYDNAGRKTITIGPDGGRIDYTYDKARNVLSEIVRDTKAAGNQTTTFTYDKVNRQRTETLRCGTLAQLLLESFKVVSNPLSIKRPFVVDVQNRPRQASCISTTDEDVPRYRI